MDRDWLCFEQIRIRRMPGFPHGGPQIADCAAGVNLVAGPNGSGKTTTAQAINALLWPHGDRWPRARLQAQFKIGRSDWQVELDAGYVQYRRDGIESAAPQLPPAESADRYNLALHDLLQADQTGQSFAQAVLRQSSGGYDVAAAANELGFRDGPRPASIAECRDLQQAEEKLRQARSRQQQSQARASQLDQLRADLEAASQAAVTAELLERALEFTRVRDQRDAAQAALAAFPTGIDKLTGDELERLKQLRARRDQARGTKGKAEGDGQKAKQDLADAALPAQGLPDSVLTTLSHRLDRLRDYDTKIDDLERRLADAQRRRDEALHGLGAAPPPTLPKIDPAALEQIRQLSQQAEQWRAAHQAAQRLQQFLSGLRPAGGQPEPQRLQQGLGLLYQWLRSAAAPSRLPFWLLLSAAAVGLLAFAALAALVHWLWLLGLVASVALLLAALFAQQSATATTAALQQQYRRLGLPAPSNWQPEQVESMAIELQQRLAAAELGQQANNRLTELESERQRLADDRAELDRRCQQLVEQFGAGPGTDQIERPTSAAWFQALARWQQAQADTAGLQAALEQTRRQRDQTLEAINRDLAPFGYERAGDCDRVAGYVEQLRRRERRWSEATAAVHQAEQAVQQAEAQMAEAEGEIKRLFQSLGLEPDQEATLQQWLQQRDRYLEAKNELQQRRGALEAAERRLKQLPQYQAGIEEKSEAELQNALERARGQASRRDELQRQISNIEAEVRQHERGHELEAALAERDLARRRLAAARHQDYRALVGHELAEFLNQQARNYQRPPVFNRAGELLARLTAGRYELDINEQDQAFRAKDTQTGRWQELDELSSATRIHVLLAVRMAFIEVQEQGLRLPLIMDETLANSDDQRAEAVIRAAIEFCRQGRQVFYFTAQPDEEAKWREVLESARDVPWTVIRLPGTGRGESASSPPPPWQQSAARRPQVPAPDGLDHRQYGQKLNVPPINPRAPAAAVHLWFLIDDDRLLHRLLQRGIESWGQLETLRRSAPAALAQAAGELDAGVLERAAAAARALETILKCWSAGRGRPVDRQTLIDSGAVSDHFIGQVAELAESLHGDAARIIEALEAGRVRGFRAAKCRKLRQFFEQNGYLPATEPMSRGQIRVATLQAANADIAADYLTVQRVDELLAMALPVQ